MEVSKDELSKVMMVGTQLAKEIQDIKRAWGPKQDKDKDKDRDRDSGCLCIEEAPGSASRSDVDPLSQSAHPKGEGEDPQGTLQRSAVRPYGLCGG